MTVNRAVTATQQTNVATQFRTVVPVRATNAWTDNAVRGVRVDNCQLAADQANRSAAAYRQYIGNGNYAGLTTPDGYAGTYLYPGAYGSALNSYYNSQSPRGALTGGRQAQNFARTERWYGRDGQPHRFWPNGYYPYFGGYGYPFFGGYGYGGGYIGSYNGDTNLGTDNDVNTGDHSVATVEGGQTAAPTDAQPTQEPATDEKVANAPAGNGPDSLVEAVQAELSRRGYFYGKVNAVYTAETKDALLRFQADQKLKITGRVNEATLHALQLD